MKLRNLFIILFYLLSCILAFGEPEKDSTGKFIVLCYHDIPKEVQEDKYGVDRASFIQTIEYLKAHGYQFISVDDILEAKEQKKALPEKSVLLTFDDAYKSFYEFVFPVLKLYKYPAVLAVVSKWIDERPPMVKHELMTWEQLREVAQDGLVEVATHTFNLHYGILYNPQGNEAAATANRRYNQQAKIYENEESYRQRLREDFQKAKETFESRLGITPRVVVWPYGKYSVLGIEEAKRVGYKMTFALNDQLASTDNLEALNRYMVYRNPSLSELLKDLKIKPTNPFQQRVIQVDLDLIYDPDPKQTELNLGRLLDRVVEMKVGTVFLQAFADPQGTGNIESVYFPNRVLPMRADLFNRVTHQLKTRAEVSVYAWMPMLSIVLPDKQKQESLRVREFKGNEISLSSSWYQRLSPFSPETITVLTQLYEDLAIHSWIDGVVFQDDGYLNDYEDFHPEALDEYKEITGGRLVHPDYLTSRQKNEWTALKTDRLIALTKKLQDVVLYHDPEARFARTLYAPVLTEPESEEWFAQNFDKSLQSYDYVVIMAYPRMEKVFRPKPWLKRMVRLAKRYPHGIEKTIFKVQTFDWDRKRWLKTATVNQWLRYLVAAGAYHVAYYPDDYTVNQPRVEVIRKMMSLEDFPYKRKK